MEPALSITGGLCVALISGLVGKAIGSNKRVKEGTCGERRESCSALIVSKIDGLSEKVDDLAEVVRNGPKAG